MSFQYPSTTQYPDTQMGAGGSGPQGAQLSVWKRGEMGGVRLASWPWRMASGLIDYGPLWFVMTIFSNLHVFALGLVISLGVIGVNNVYMQGLTGQSLGKRIVGTRVVSAVEAGVTEFELVYPGIGRCLGRQLAHSVDSIAYIGFIRPLWQRQYRCWSDAMAKTVVLARSESHLAIRERQPGEATQPGL
jgi:uncharacterized RDD family membrane protein YckC